MVYDCLDMNDRTNVLKREISVAVFTVRGKVFQNLMVVNRTVC